MNHPGQAQRLGDRVPPVCAPPTVPDYDLLKRIGGGAYGDVWLACNRATGTMRAAKIVWRSKFEDERPFQREFQGIQRFERVSRGHPSQLALFHIGRNEVEGYFYYVMELADNHSPQPQPNATDRTCETGQWDWSSYTPHTLRASLAQGRLPADGVLDIGLALTEALGHLHQNGLVHRDVKPSNVIFVNGRPKLADIGLVTDASDQCSIVGTEGYMPPEGPGTARADIFALGRVLYEASTGQDRREFPKLPQNLRSWPDAPLVLELNEIILACCAAEPASRYGSAEPILADLRRLREGRSVKQRRIWQRRLATSRKAAVALAVGSGIAALLSYGSKFGQMDPYPEGPPSTNEEARVLCDRGMQILRVDDFDLMPEAYTNFQRALGLHPGFARPYVGLLEMAVREPPAVLGPAGKEMTLRLAADKLQELAPDLGATAVAQAIIHFYQGDFDTADRLAKRAIKANPKFELGYTWYAFMLTRWGKAREARECLQKSENLMESKAIVHHIKGHIFYLQRDFTNAIACYRRSIELSHGHLEASYTYLGRALRASGDYEGSMDVQEQGELRNSPGDTRIVDHYLKLRQAYRAYHDRGRQQQAFWEQAWNSSRGGSNYYFQACVQIQLSHTNEARALLTKSLATPPVFGRERDLNQLIFDDCWDPVRAETWFADIVDKAGFTKVLKRR